MFLLLSGSKVVISPPSFHFESASGLGFGLFTCSENLMESCVLQSVGPKVVIGLPDSVSFFCLIYSPIRIFLFARWVPRQRSKCQVTPRYLRQINIHYPGGCTTLEGLEVGNSLGTKRVN